jgi:pre-mRNA-splicing factor ISY1
MKDIDADYYGYRDDDDGILTPLEQNEERRGTAYPLFLMQSLDK